MAVLTGYAGHVSKGDLGGGNESAISTRGWGVSITTAGSTFSHSGSKNAEIAAIGRISWDGHYSAVGHTPVLFPGEGGEFEGAITGTDESAVGVSGDIIAQQTTITIPHSNYGEITHEVIFGGSGELTRGTVTCPEDDNLADIACADVCKIQTSAVGGVLADLDDVGDITIVMTMPLASLPSQSSAWNTRAIDGPLGCTLTFDMMAQDDDGWAGMPMPGSIYVVKVFVSATQFYLFNWMVCESNTAMDVVRVGGGPVSGRVAMRWRPYTIVTDTVTEGTLTLPNTNELWPPA